MAKNTYRSPMEYSIPVKGLDSMVGVGSEDSNPTMPSPGVTGSFPFAFGDDTTASPAHETTPFVDAQVQVMKQGGAATFKPSPLTSPFDDAIAKTFKK